MPLDDLVGPVAASPWWAITAAILIAAAAAWLVWVLVHTRRRPTPPAPGAPDLRAYSTGGDPFAGLRERYLQQVDAVAHAFATGQVDVRELHLRLSAIVREFAGHRSGVDASVMTLSDIERLTGAGRLASLIARYYQPSFSRETDATGQDSIDGARTVISTW